MILLIILSFHNWVNGQNFYIDSLIKENDLTEHKADQILNEIKNDTLKLRKRAFNFSRFFYKKQNPNLNLAIKYANVELKLLDQIGEESNHYHSAIYRLGLYNIYAQRYDSAIYYLKKASEINTYKKRKGQAYCELGRHYFKKGYYHKSTNYYSKGLDLLKEYGKPSSTFIHAINMSQNAYKTENKHIILKCIYYFNMIDSITKSNANIISNTRKINLNVGFGNLYSLKPIDSLQKAMGYYKKALKLSIKNKNFYYLALTNMNIAESYIYKQRDSAKFYVYESLKYSEKIVNEEDSNFIIAGSYLNASRYFLSSKKLKKSLDYANKAMKKYCFVNDINDINSLNLLKNQYKKNTLIALKLKVNILFKLYEREQKVSYINQIIESVNISNLLVNLILKESTETITQLFWRDDVSEIYSYGVLAAYYLKDNNLFFDFIEKNKAFLLTQSIKQNNLTSNLSYKATLDDALFRKKILDIESRTTNENKFLNDSLFNLKLKYERFKDSLKLIYPDYFSKKNNVQSISLSELKQKLDNKTAVLSYDIVKNYNSDNYELLGLVNTREKSISFKVPLTQKEYSLFSKYKKLISKPFSQKEQLIDFKEVSYKLNTFLFPNSEINRLIKNKDFIIITNGELQNLPFEALVTKKKSLKYLIEDHNISYAYSASFLDFNNSLKRETSKNLAAFAPVSFSNSELKSLQATEAEVKTISNEMSSDVFTNINATKTNFLNNSDDYKILHLATHATSSDNPAIYFSKDTLQLHELYTHKTNADLVVLSACESNLGEIKKGEGVFSLSRGFFYSGAKSVISSLWNVNDVSTSSIMKDFYKNLNNNQSKSEALNNAKRNYLKEHSLSEKSPYYWASFVLIGDTSPTYPATPYWIYLLGVVALFSIILFFFKKRG
ncbi:CHAT domain-containing protein [Tenacibaculum skagerrakense]|uniref:CHAT domain-containing protein n=1 Tax=Tenacibaculum skagerrakense TaxID=186571 RepID=A0A4R2NRT0_9FLAO|nr:CHAT domain-containing protein [Tenacibaculum skagerrakense]TCP24211.1 CHAT domain-containing protein [Tenacibaculum skagerrakense]